MNKCQREGVHPSCSLAVNDKNSYQKAVKLM